MNYISDDYHQIIKCNIIEINAKQITILNATNSENEMKFLFREMFMYINL